MAKFSVAYGLCPLVDSESLLGVNVDKDVDCGIVTIGKNMVIRYKFQDQKQVSSWSTKDKLSSPVIYNSFLSEYTAVFNHEQLRMWKEDDELDKVKKFKFQEPLHSVIPDPDGNCAFVLYQCGQIATVTQALETRKEGISNPILSNKETITDYTALICNCMKYVAFTSIIDEKELYLNLISVADTSSYSRHVLTCVNSGSTIVGYTLMSLNNSCHLVTLWSDGSLYSFKFLPEISDKFPGVFLQKITCINTKHPVAITSISSSYLSFFGADCSEEGAMLILFNLQFHLIQAKLHFKLYTKPPRIWNVSNHLLLTVGNNLIAVPYVLEVEQLSTLVGIYSSPLHYMTETSWDDSASDEPMSQNVNEEAPENIEERVELLKLEGLPQASILEKVIPDILEKKDSESILWCLKNFSDFPEHLVVRLLVSFFSVSNFLIVPASPNANGLEVLENGISHSEDEACDSVKGAGDYNRPAALINAVLNLSITDTCIIPHMQRIPFDIILDLLKYLNHVLDDESSVSLHRAIDWICLILDSRYREFRVCQKEEVTLLIKDIKNKIHSQLEYMKELKMLYPILRRLEFGNLSIKPPSIGEKMYSVEPLHLY